MTGDRVLTWLLENGEVGAPHGLKPARRIINRALIGTTEVVP